MFLNITMGNLAFYTLNGNCSNLPVDVPPNVHKAFAGFQSDTRLFALPLTCSDTTLQALPPVAYPEGIDSMTQATLNQLESVFSPRTSLYLILRRGDSLVVVTFVPYLANADRKKEVLQNRHTLVQALGPEHFSTSIVCKEIGEITDARSWDERDGKGQLPSHEHDGDTSECTKCYVDDRAKLGVKDLGYKKNKCRLCDRRMKNKIEDGALEALKSLSRGGDCIQIVSCAELPATTRLTCLQSVNIQTEVLQLNFRAGNVDAAQVAARLPTDRPSFTFYRHPANSLLYFIFCSPDSATVQERMKHTMAIPGLVNIIAKDNGVNVDQKIEIHDPEDLEFAEGDDRIGKFRSMYLRNQSVGTESRWEGMEEYQRVLDSVV